MKLVIAEKPMLARDIARAICGTPVPESAPLPISGNGYTVIACSGHLLELVEPEAVNPAWADRYDLDLLPISIPDWPKEPAVVRDKETGEVIDSKEPLHLQADRKALRLQGEAQERRLDRTHLRQQAQGKIQEEREIGHEYPRHERKGR